MHITNITWIIASICFKVVIKEGVTVASVVVARNINIIVMSILFLKGKSPFKEIPWVKKSVLPAGSRIVLGQLNFALYNVALPLLPLGVLTIIHKTSPFWSSIMGYFILREKVLPIEIVGIIICFGAFIALTLSDKDSEDDSDSQDDKVGLA